MKTTPTISKQSIQQFASDLNQYILQAATSDYLPNVLEFLQNVADSCNQEDAETLLASVDHILEYDPFFFTFRYTTEPLPVSSNKYSITLEFGVPSKPYTITVTSRI